MEETTTREGKYLKSIMRFQEFAFQFLFNIKKKALRLLFNEIPLLLLRESNTFSLSLVRSTPKNGKTLLIAQRSEKIIFIRMYILIKGN